MRSAGIDRREIWMEIRQRYLGPTGCYRGTEKTDIDEEEYKDGDGSIVEGVLCGLYRTRHEPEDHSPTQVSTYG